MKLVILGPTGATGRHVVEQALRAGHQVVAVAREPSKVTVKDPKLTVIGGKPTDATLLEKALAGADALISTLGPRSKKDPICAEAATAVVAAMKAARVRRVVWISAGGVGDSAAPITRASFVFGRIIMPLFLRHPYANHLKAEETLRASGLDWTVLRPLQLVDQRTGNTVTANLGDAPLRGLKIAREDLASFLLEETAHPKHLRAMPMVHA